MEQNGEKLNTNAALNFACAKGHKGMVEYLINSTDEGMDSAKEAGLIIACNNAHLEVAKFLVSNLKMTQEMEAYLNTPNNGNKLGNDAILELFQQENLNQPTVQKLKR